MLNTETIYIIVFIVVFLFLGWSLYVYIDKKNKQRALTEKGNNKQEEVYKWFEEQVDNYEKESLAYGIELESDKQEISIFLKEKLREQYGKVLLEPSLLVYNTYNTKFGSDYIYLDKAIKDWITNNYREVKQDDKPLKQIENLISNRCSEKAKSIVSESVKD